eukprot:4873184-Pleurochrysis_carterae.AAC.1
MADATRNELLQASEVGCTLCNCQTYTPTVIVIRLRYEILIQPDAKIADGARGADGGRDATTQFASSQAHGATPLVWSRRCTRQPVEGTQGIQRHGNYVVMSDCWCGFMRINDPPQFSIANREE